MDTKVLFQIALSFRDAIQMAKLDLKFYSKDDRMKYFPRGCCDDAADLLGYYLSREYNIISKQRKGEYWDADPNNRTYHAWIELEDGIIIDITADQFSEQIESIKGVYVGKINGFYCNLKDLSTYEHYNIINDPRLWHDYQAICGCISLK